ncbi:PH domain-containing protein [Acidithiobacillus sp.]|uniref:PH domain-containing protein n=1 Tax=Acidithiobacillus sp. TaxID=1872118 RepID=UPI003D06826A
MSGIAGYAARQVDNALTPGEHVQYAGMRHPIHLLGPAIGALAVGAASVAAWVYAHADPAGVCAAIHSHAVPACAAGLSSVAYLLPMMGLGVAAMILGVAVVNWQTRLLVLTERRLLMTSMYGFRINDLPLYSLRDAQLQQPMLGLAFGYATIVLTTPDGTMRLSKVRDAKGFYRILSAVAFPTLQQNSQQIAARQP